MEAHIFWMAIIPIFGKVIKGMEVIDKIAAVNTDEADWPLQNIFIKKAEIIN